MVIAIQLVKKFPPSLEPDGSLQCSQDPANLDRYLQIGFNLVMKEKNQYVGNIKHGKLKSLVHVQILPLAKLRFFTTRLVAFMDCKKSEEAAFRIYLHEEAIHSPSRLGLSRVVYRGDDLQI